MPIIWGTRKTKRKLGYVAEVCPTCGVVRTIKLIRVGMATHVYYVALGFGELVGFVGNCLTCGKEFDLHPIDYPVLEKNKNAPMDALIAKTNPKLQPANQPAMVAFQRYVEIRRPLLYGSLLLQSRYANGTVFDRIAGLAFLATVAIPSLLLFALFQLPVSQSVSNVGSAIAMALFPIGLFVSFVLLFTESRRYFARQLKPEILGALKSLNPQLDELELCMKAFRKYGYPIRKYISAQQLVDELRDGALRGA